MKTWLESYVRTQKETLNAIPLEQVIRIIGLLSTAAREDRQIFVCGNGGSASNASHFATDLGKGASDKLGKRFRVLSLNDNVSWLTALGNDYAYDQIYSAQLQNYARPGDILLLLSVSGSSPNLVKAAEFAREKAVHTIALVGGKRGKLAQLADEAVVVSSEHYGRAEDAQMTICHMLCYAFIEGIAKV